MGAFYAWPFKIFYAIVVVLILILAGLESMEVYRAISTTDAQVTRLCDNSISRNLTCWCYNQHARTCPENR